MNLLVTKLFSAIIQKPVGKSYLLFVEGNRVMLFQGWSKKYVILQNGWMG